MRSSDPQHQLLDEARDLVVRLRRRQKEIHAEHGTGTFAPRSPARRVARAISAAETRAEERADACECPDCEIARAEDRRDEEGDRKLDEERDREWEDRRR